MPNGDPDSRGNGSRYGSSDGESEEVSGASDEVTPAVKMRHKQRHKRLTQEVGCQTVSPRGSSTIKWSASFDLTWVVVIKFPSVWLFPPHGTITSKINGTHEGVYSLISKLLPISSVASKWTREPLWGYYLFCWWWYLASCLPKAYKMWLIAIIGGFYLCVSLLVNISLSAKLAHT